MRRRELVGKYRGHWECVSLSLLNGQAHRLWHLRRWCGPRLELGREISRPFSRLRQGGTSVILGTGGERDGSGLGLGSSRLDEIDAAHCGQQTRTHLHGDTGERGGARVGKVPFRDKPKWARIRTITSGSTMAAEPKRWMRVTAPV